MLFGILLSSFGVLHGCHGLALPVPPPAEVVGSTLLYASTRLGENESQVDEGFEIGVGVGVGVEVEGGHVVEWIVWKNPCYIIVKE